jgi:hypothetical protein
MQSRPESSGVCGFRKIHDDLRGLGERCGKHRPLPRGCGMTRNAAADCRTTDPRGASRFAPRRAASSLRPFALNGDAAERRSHRKKSQSPSFQNAFPVRC